MGHLQPSVLRTQTCLTVSSHDCCCAESQKQRRWKGMTKRLWGCYGVAQTPRCIQVNLKQMYAHVISGATKPAGGVRISPIYVCLIEETIIKATVPRTVAVGGRHIEGIRTMENNRCLSTAGTSPEGPFTGPMKRPNQVPAPGQLPGSGPSPCCRVATCSRDSSLPPSLMGFLL